MKSMHGPLLACTVFGALALPQQARAQSAAGTIQKMRDTGVIALGVRDSSLPFSYIDGQHSHVGYAVDICLRIVEALKRELNLPQLKTEKTAVTSSNRIPLMSNGTIDLECGSTTNNAERQKQVAFGPTYFLTASKFVAKKSANLKGLEDLRGKPVVSTAGSTNIVQLTRANADQKLDITVIAARDHGEAFLMVETGRAAAFVMDDVIIAGLVASSKDPDSYALGDYAFSKPEPYGFMLRRNDVEFKTLVDRVAADVYRTEGKALYAKWFQAPVPPNNLNLRFPMSPQLEAAFAHPTDSPDPDAY